jgi:hypothetical protein
LNNKKHEEAKLSIEKQFKGNVGMYLVAAKLSQMNLIVLTTSRNTKGYDIVVLNPSTNRGKGIQVKCSDRREFPILQSFLKDYLQEIQRKIMSDFVFVDISNLEHPRFFVIPMEEMRRVIQKSIEEWMYRTPHKKSIAEMKKTEKKKQQWTLDLEDIEEYEDNWKPLIESLGS